MSFTYSELKTALQNYTENDETTFVNTLPTFIRICEERILKSVQLTLFIKNATGATISGQKFLAQPTDFLAPFSLALTNSSGTEVFLDFKDVDFVQSFSPSSETGFPRYYASFDNDNFILSAKPDAAYSVELHYYYRPTSLTAGADSGTTWLSENAEVALLYGSLIECYTFMKGEPDLLAVYEKRFVEAISSLKMLGESKQVTDEYRTGKVIRPKQ